MILVVPFVGPSDYMSELSSRLLKLGGLGGHRLIVPSAPGNLAEAEAFVEAVRSQFVSASVLRVDSPGAPVIRLFRDGLMAAAAVKTGATEIPNHPVLWLEPGYLPTKADWADALQSAFFNSGGGLRILAEWRKCPDLIVGSGTARHTVPGGWAPVGPAVFPSAFIRAAEMIHRLNDGSGDWRKVLQFIFTTMRAESPALSNGAESLLVVPTQEPVKSKPLRSVPARPVAEPATSDA